MTEKRIYGRFVLLGEGRLIRDGGIYIRDGVIKEAGDWKIIWKNHPGVVEEFPHSIILPGLINSHTHLEIPRSMGTPMRFVPWLLERIKHNQGEFDPAETVREGIEQCLAHGVTCVGDIATRVKEVREVLGRSPLRGISFGEIRAMGKSRERLGERIQVAKSSLGLFRMSAGLSPHAPYSVEVSGYRRIVREGLPIATHLAESEEERAFLEWQRGGLRGLWRYLPWWDDSIERFSGTPVEMAKETGLLDATPPVLLVHMNYCEEEDLALLEKSRAAVVYCPRTHQFFGHLPHPFKQMTARGIRVVLGTDSLASTEDLDILEEVRCVHRLGVSPVEAIGMASWKASDLFGAVGQIEVGFHADLAVFGVTGDEPLEELMAWRGKARRVMIGGEWV